MIDINTGVIVHELKIEGVVDDVVTFPNSGGIVITKPTVKRPSLGKPVQIAGLPRVSHTTNIDQLAINYQRVYHLNPDNFLAYEAMTYPSLQARWQTQAQRGELFGISASINGEMVGFAIAELFVQANSGQQETELLSLFVLSAYRHQGIGTTLVKHLQQLIGKY